MRESNGETAWYALFGKGTPLGSTGSHSEGYRNHERGQYEQINANVRPG